MRNIKNFILINLIIIFEEMIFSYFIFNQISNVIYKIIFSIIFSNLICMIIKCFNSKHQRIARNIIVLIITFIFSAQFVYYQIYKSIISIYSFTNGGQVFQFWQTILEVIKTNWDKILFLLFPNIFLFGLYYTRKNIRIVITITRRKNKSNESNEYDLTDEQTINICKEKNLIKTSKFSRLLNNIKAYLKSVKRNILMILVLQIAALICINTSSDTSVYSVKNLYNNAHVPTLMAEKFGLITTMRLDLQKLVLKSSNTTLIAVSSDFNEINKEKIPEYNMLDINWEKIIEQEDNQTLKSMHEYFSVQEPTQKNDYTGMFEGKNVVVFVAEAFNEVAIHPNITPTLYKLYSQGFQFDNFYTPLFPVSTADGEYISDTSLIPKENVWSISKISNNYMPYSYANAFENLGYKSYSYHNHSASYYDRDDYLKGMGYDSYLARGTGLEKRMDCSHWPNSDLDMINATVDDYINDEKFVAYYMTVSGHLEYNTGGNYIANKNWNLVKDLPYSSKAKCYMATQIELDKAVESLINKLEVAGKLENTVIVISGDHYPYGLTLQELNELSDYEKDDNFEKHRMPLLIWSGSMKEPVKVDKVGCSLDILPTVLNLFGIKYDSRLLMGTDLLSNSEGLVIFSNRSFITSKGRYNSLTKKFETNENEENEEIEEEYVDNISKIIYNKYQMSRMILENDYYRVLFDEISRNMIK